MALLRIVRDSGHADRIRAYRVVVDGNTVGKIGDGETKEFPVSAGPHNLSIKIDWCGSKAVPFTVAEGEVLAFDAKSNLRGIRVIGAFLLALFAWSFWVVLSERR
jgi:hypothetical protein